MNNSKVKTVIILGIVSIFCILTIQFFWIKRNIEYQQTNIEIQNIQDSLSDKQFSENVSLALKNVATDIQKINKQKSDLYGKVLQQSSNYFTVELEDTLHPFLLENLLKAEFYHQNIKDDFRYGIYDCYSDSVIYGDYIRYSGDSVFVIEKNNNKIDAKLQQKLETDVHYFAVSFPNRQSYSIEDTSNSVTPWYYLIGILIFILAFFGFTISIILRQKKLSEIKNDFINNMTHELKTPISTIRLSSESLLYSSDNSKDKVEKFASIIYKENKRLEQQVERVLNIAKLDKGEVNLTFSTFDIHEIIEEAKDNFEVNQLEEGKRSIKLNLMAEKHIVHSDMVHLTNVIYNLLDNATKYCDDIPNISIKTSNFKHQINISIKDNGKGIAKENLKLIFDKFYRVPTGNVHDVKGFGLGLFYVKTIIDKLNGTISVASHLNQGSEFVIAIPVNERKHE
ncbi:MAG: sensor histidine kinase [Crocinitomicaceae bacterium]